jgi:hypothetical protein
MAAVIADVNYECAFFEHGHMEELCNGSEVSDIAEWRTGNLRWGVRWVYNQDVSVTLAKA